ncbi:kinase A anchor protein [Pseudomassariella vexata]|uniref:Kinase A anchor protein n=1 Tax=Pseudomassariella vexata TaxID=1141098 RepID=A0A1Y2DXV9_9PEZI|nr:kinase A anchor protein [Pseudomassariella vexata]ORY64111.1 kinase A anchor protein [Pseudomassariella vexata]
MAHRMPPRPSPTHFLCVQLVTGSSRPQLSKNLGAFRDDVTSPNSYGIPAEAIRPVGTLHLTLGVMSFPKDEGVEKAVALLKSLLPRRILSSIQVPEAAETAETKEPPGPPPPLLSVTLKGIHPMKSASKATVLYAPPVDSQGILQKFCEKLKAAFQEEGLMLEENRPLLLHATIINTIYVKGARHGKERERVTIDARGILDRYDDYVWMEDIPVEKIAICRMGARKLDDGDEAYDVEAEIDVA